MKIQIRVSSAQRDLIDEAPHCLCWRRSDFIVQAAFRRAEAVLLDAGRFTTDETSFAALRLLLDELPVPTDQLRRTLNATAPWDISAETGNPTGHPAKRSRSP